MRQSAFAVLACLGLGITQPLAAQSTPDIVAEHNAALQRGDLEGFLATFSEDAVVIAAGDEFHGRVAIAAGFAPDFAPGSPLVRVKRQGRLAGGGIVQQAVHVFADGSEECCTTRVIHVRDGQVARLVVETNDLGG